MVQAAKLIGAGSALIALAGVGAGIGIVFGSRALLCCCLHVVRKTHLLSLCLDSSKARSPDVIGNDEVRSENESPVSDGSCHETQRRASVGMTKIMNLIYTFSGSEDPLIHIFLKNHLTYGFLPVIKESLTEIMPGDAYQAGKNVQGSNPTNHMDNGTAGWPKGRKPYGYRVPIVGGVRMFSTEGGQANGRSSVKMIIKPTGSDLLMALRNQNISNNKIVNFNLIHIVSDLEILVLAYEMIKSNPGNMTKGPTETTLDGTNLAKMLKVSNLLKAGKYSFGPGRRVWIPKPGKKVKRPLGIRSPQEKIIQKALQLVLEAIYEPSFLECSHGFRPSRGTHTCMKILDQKFQGASWVIEADISQCFDRIDHKLLMKILSKRIGCQKTLALIKSALKAGYIDLGKWVSSGRVGTPQGSILSPLLCNVYLHELDQYIMELKLALDKGKRRRPNPVYEFVRRRMRTCTKNDLNDVKTYRLLRTIMRQTSSVDFIDPKFVRVQYVRYADDFVISIAGPRSLAREIQNKVQTFLRESLKLEMSNEKTHLTHFTHKPIQFLGFSIPNRMLAEKPVIRKITGKRERTTIRLSLHAPIREIVSHLAKKGFMKWNKDGIYCKGTALRRMINLDHATILKYYQSVIYGIINYYSFVDNRPMLAKVVYQLKCSCALTLALKYKLRHLSKAFRKFGGNLKDPETELQLKTPSTYIRTREFMVNPPKAYAVMAMNWNSKMTKSNLFKCCIICGAFPVEIHHVRKLRELKQRPHLDWFTTQMAAVNRKQVPLCKIHHIHLHRNTLSQEERAMFGRGLRAMVQGKVESSIHLFSCHWCFDHLPFAGEPYALKSARTVRRAVLGATNLRSCNAFSFSFC